MGKPRMIILVRHAQSEGNKNREIHQFIPDHRVKLTPDGQQQAEDAGRRLRDMLKPDDTLHFFTSPYRRTRETTEGILKTLTCDDPTPSPFPRHTITVYEEPRLREQDFGNFQPCSAEMERMWQERADYGHFFYRIPNGESAADAYDRVSGFNESLWRQFGENDFPSVCVLVTHGLMTRVFLMKWYHWSVEYFEDLRNINHCEFIVMKQNEDNGKYILQNQLRTWSDLKKRAAALESGSSAAAKAQPKARESSPSIPVRRWGGCANGCNHGNMVFPRRARRQNTSDFLGPKDKEVKKADADGQPAAADGSPVSSKDTRKTGEKMGQRAVDEAANADGMESSVLSSPREPTGSSSESEDPFSSDGETRLPFGRPRFLSVGRDFGGSHSGVGTPAEGLSDDSDYFDPHGRQALAARSRSRQASIKQAAEWATESGMGAGAKADKLGDGDDDTDGQKSPEPTGAPAKGSSMRQALRQADAAVGPTTDAMVDAMKERDRKSWREVY